jgi:DNA-damage-inducible protein J
MKNAVVRARVDADLKARASAVLASCGLEVSDALRLFLKQVVAQNGIPFRIHAPAVPEPAGAELARLEQASQERDRRIAASDDVSGGEMFLIRPEKARSARIRWPDADLE